MSAQESAKPEWHARVCPQGTRQAGLAPIRDLNVTVSQILERLARGAEASQLLAEIPGLELADIQAAMAYAAACLADAQPLKAQEYSPGRASEEAGTIAAPPAMPEVPVDPAEQSTLAPQDVPPTARSAGPLSIPGYEVFEELGHGGMGVVYKARHIKLNRQVALKMILGGGLAGSEMMRRFRLEAEAVARLQHPGIVQIYEIGEWEGSPFITLEYIAGGTLAARLQGTPLTEREAAMVLQELAQAVHYAHKQDVIHRDLKPANILLQKDEGRRMKDEEGSHKSAFILPPSSFLLPKVTDFGLAKILEADRGQTRTGEILGTPSYLAPEQAAGKTKNIGPATDVYSLGAVLYEMLTGKPPFLAETPMDTLLQVLEQDPVPVRQLNPSASKDIETICLKCLRKEPAQRYATAQALADDLERFLKDEPIKARPPGFVEKARLWLKHHQLLAVSYVLAVAAVVLFLNSYQIFAPGIFAFRGVPTHALYFATLPAVLAMYYPVRQSRPAVLSLGTLLAGAGVWAWMHFFVTYSATIGYEQEFVRALACGFLAAGAVGAALGHWRSLLVVLVPVLLVCGLSGWYFSRASDLVASVDLPTNMIVGQRPPEGVASSEPAPDLNLFKRSQPFQPLAAGILHGFVLAILARMTAWCLNREMAATALGAWLGALASLFISDLYATRFGTPLLASSGLSPIATRLCVQGYLEILLAFLMALAFGVLLGKRPKLT